MEIIKPILESVVKSVVIANTIGKGGGSSLIRLVRNSDIVETSGSPSISTAEPNLACSDKYFLNKNNIMRVRQSGSITQISIFIPSTVTVISVFYIQVWRFDGTNYDRIAQVDITSRLVANQVNTVTLPSALQCIEGDYIGLGGTITGGSSQVTAVVGYAANSLSYTTNEIPGENDFDWDSKSTLAYILPIKTYQQAPMVVGIGDSIMAGHPIHYSYIENSMISVVANQILYQLAVLDNKYIYQNMGFGSHTTTHIKNRFVTHVVDLKPKIAIIQGGVNDIGGGSITKATFLANYTTMLDDCVAANIIPVVCKIIPWTGGSNVEMQTRDLWMIDLQALVNTYSGSVWVDFDAAIGKYRAGGDAGNLWDIQTTPNYAEDSVHLNLAGYAKMAEVINTAIKSKYIIAEISAPNEAPNGTPSGLILTVISDTEIQLDWTAGSTNHDGHSIERSTDGVAYAEIATVTGATVHYHNIGLSGGVHYYYRVCAYKGTVYSAYSAVDDDYTTLSAPSGLTLTVVSNTELQLDWTDNSIGESGFKIERSTDDITYAQIDTFATNHYHDTTCEEGTLYYYKVRAYIGSVNSSYCTAASSSTAISLLLTSTGTGAGVATLIMTASEDTILTLGANAKFYSNSGGTNDESATWTVTAGAARTRYIKCTTGTATFGIEKNKIIAWGNPSVVTEGWTSGTNAPSVSGDISKLTALTTIRIAGLNALSGNIALLTSLTAISLSSSNTLSGSITNLTSLTRLSVTGSNTLSGSITNLTSLTYLNVPGSNTLSGSLTNLTSLTYLALIGSNTVTGDISTVSNGLTYCEIRGLNQIVDYTSGGNWGSILASGTIRIQPANGYGLSSAEIDLLLQEISATKVEGRAITVTVNSYNAARTAASDAAVADIVADGGTVVTT